MAAWRYVETPVNPLTTGNANESACSLGRPKLVMTANHGKCTEVVGLMVIESVFSLEWPKALTTVNDDENRAEALSCSLAREVMEEVHREEFYYDLMCG